MGGGCGTFFPWWTTPSSARLFPTMSKTGVLSFRMDGKVEAFLQQRLEHGPDFTIGHALRAISGKVEAGGIQYQGRRYDARRASKPRAASSAVRHFLPSGFRLRTPGSRTVVAED